MFDINSVILQLKEIPHITAIVIGGSHATGTNRPDSDIDIGLYYKEKEPFDIGLIRELASEINDAPDPLVSDFGGWGTWVNGGTWLTVKGQRLDFIYRNVDLVKETINDCIKGKIKSDYYQEPPSGFHSFIYCAETQACKIIYDPTGIVKGLKERVKTYPSKLKQKIINSFLWDTEFALSRAKNFALRDEINLVASSVTRISYDLVQVLYALNNCYFMSVKKTYKDIPHFKNAPDHFIERVEHELSSIGSTSESLTKTLTTFERLIEETKSLSKNIYVPKYN